MVKKKAPLKKPVAGKKTGKNNSSYFMQFRYIGISFLVVVLALSVFGVRNFLNTAVLGTETSLARGGDENRNRESDRGKTEQKDAVEPTEKVEPTDVPEPTETPEKKEQEARKIETEVKQHLETKQAEKIELQPASESTTEGKVVIEQKFGRQVEFKAPVSTEASLMQFQTSQAGVVSMRLGSNNEVTINNGPYSITTKFPVVINPQDQTMAIRTPSGITIVKTFPAEFLRKLPQGKKFNSVASIQLKDEGGIPVYQAEGIQVRRFLGVLPVSGKVSENINAQTGEVTTVSLPWYFSLFGFAFKST